MVDGGTIESKMQKAGGNLSAVLGDLDAGHWILGGGPRSDPFWREDEVLVIEDTTAKESPLSKRRTATGAIGNVAISCTRTPSMREPRIVASTT